MKIGIFSDTHRKIQRAEYIIELFKQRGVEFIIHAGDIVEPKVLELLQTSGIRYVAVFGNNDAHLASYYNKYNLVQEPHYFKLADTKFKLMHLPFYMSADTEVIIYGHTHKFDCEFNHGTLFLNPGESCARNKDLSEAIILEVTKSEFHVTYFSRNKKMEAENIHFHEQYFNFTREKNG